MSIQIEYEGPSFVFTFFKDVKENTKKRLGETGWRNLIHDLSEAFSLWSFSRVDWDKIEHSTQVLVDAPIEKIIRVLPPLKKVADDYELAFVLEKKLRKKLREKRNLSESFKESLGL